MSHDGVERIGLLFVHGIGEQARFEHLRNSVTEFAELMLQSDEQAQVSVIDRTEGWASPPGQPEPAGVAPITLTFRSASKHIHYDCHEVWWADLGARAGLLDAITFWLWGLGQWAAPIYREVDASRLDKDAAGYSKQVPSLAKLPRSVAGRFQGEPITRLRLLLAALAALFVALTWSLAKRLAGAALGQSPSPTLIVRYVGDVRTYEERATPGQTALSDPGYPRRVGIRRRMVSEMVSLAAKPLDHWYVVAHSLGTVVAYNGLTEIGHTLPNYLPREQWDALDPSYKRDWNCALRRDLHAMMPARPDWLMRQDVINRELLFEKLRGVLTYGSPLDKFAALWPRIVATATDRINGVNPFPAGCRWINLAAVQDPVAGSLDSFGGDERHPLHGSLPPISNRSSPWNLLYGLAHIRYFKGAERCDLGAAAVQRRTVMKWLLGGMPEAIDDRPLGQTARLLLGPASYCLLVALLWTAAAGTLAAAGGTIRALLGSDGAVAFRDIPAFVRATAAVAGPLLGLALTVITGFGLWRWFRESALQVDLARADQASDSGARENYWKIVIRMLRRHRTAGLIILLIGGMVTLPALYLDLGGRLPADFSDHLSFAALSGCRASISALGAAVFAAVIQTFINATVDPASKGPLAPEFRSDGQTGPEPVDRARV